MRGSSIPLGRVLPWRQYICPGRKSYQNVARETFWFSHRGGSVQRQAFVRGDAVASLRMAGAVELGRLQARRAPNLKHKSEAQVASKGDAIAASASHPARGVRKLVFEIRPPPFATMRPNVFATPRRWFEMEKAGFDPSVNVRFRHEMEGGLRFPATGTEISNPNFTIGKAARAAGVCPRTVRKWVARYREYLAARTRPRRTRGVYQTTQSLIDPAGFWVLKARR